MAKYAVSDLHGMYNLWAQVKNFITEDDVLYILGDCIDRGEDGWQIIKEIIDMPNVVYLRGNHEQMMIDGERQIWIYNGGEPTIKAMNADTYEEWDRVFSWIKENTIYDVVEITNENNDIILLSHTGCSQIKFSLWDRHHLSNEWRGEDNVYIIHGHTPVQYMPDFVYEENMKDTKAFWYAEGHKVCIDPGSFISNETILFNLDTFEELIFKGEWYE